MKMVDVFIVGAGPVGLMCAYLSQISNLSYAIIDKSDAPLAVGRADALNARTLQLLEIAGLFEEVYPLGKPCNTSSIFKNGKFISRQSTWWDELEGCYHKHFLMLGQCHIEKIIDQKLKNFNNAVLRKTTIETIEKIDNRFKIKLSNGDIFISKYLIGADGSRSYIRNFFNIDFNIVRPEITWAVIDGIINSNFPKVPEIIVFQNDTSDVAWIPREGNLDRFYIRMDKKEFSYDKVLSKIKKAVAPYEIDFDEIEWSSQFSVKESVAQKFSIDNKVFLVGDACHIHSVNGGQGLNTGLGDAFNLMWKINMVENYQFDSSLLSTYETERKPVAESVIESSGELVRATKFSESNNHAQDYIDIVKKRAGNITGMGIRYQGSGEIGSRMPDMKRKDNKRLYSILDYSKFSIVKINDEKSYLVRPDGYISVVNYNESKINGNFQVISV